MAKRNATAEGQTPSAEEPGFFDHPAVRSILERNVGVYLATGIGLLLTVVLAPDLISLLGMQEFYELTLERRFEQYLPAGIGPTDLFMGLFLVFIVLLIGPVIGALLGVISARSPLTTTRVASANAIGAFVGYTLMFLLVFLLAGSQAELFEVGIGSALANALPLALPSGVVCGATAYLVNR